MSILLSTIQIILSGFCLYLFLDTGLKTDILIIGFILSIYIFLDGGYKLDNSLDNKRKEKK